MNPKINKEKIDHLGSNDIKVEMSEFRKSTYIPKSMRKNILLLSDDL